ncbi:uncharacterized protein BXZ73DRAFT_46467, partial [Epithele typhae]|uniref:uncharacterized protein n=1 Tax=Epithele typhae TaxID=378194 RepID=UPI0020074BDB
MRTRSQSTPSRPRALSVGATHAAKERSLNPIPAPVSSTVSSLLSSRPPPAHTSTPLAVPTPVTPSKKPVEPPLRSTSTKRKLFRLKRPSAPLPSHPPPMSPGFSHAPPPPPPPRPPRNPARAHPARPSSPSRPQTQDRSPPAPRPSRIAQHEPTPPGDIADAEDWVFPLPKGSEFPLQRKKSKTSRCEPSRLMVDESARNDAPFSTVDRTILAELRQKIRAREAQFVVRGGKKYHACRPDEVPYPRSYDRQVVDMDVWDNLWQRQLGGSVTMHTFETSPARVLIGTRGEGTGTWILHAAREWKDSHFVGLDVVPLHPDLLQIGSFDLAARITWVQANFLERLPFPNEEFDYVRVVRVGRGVPEDKWDTLLEEITRVMKPGGAFEMLEENLHFPGSRIESASIIDTSDPPQPPTPPRTDSSHSSEQERHHLHYPHPHPSSPYAQPSSSMALSYSYEDITKMRRSQQEEYRPSLHSISSSPDVSKTQMPPRSRTTTLERPPTNPHDHSLIEMIYNEMHSARFVNTEPVSLLANLLPLHFRNVRSPPPILIPFPSTPESRPRSIDGLPRSSPDAVPQRRSRASFTESEDDDYFQSAKRLSNSPHAPLLHASDIALGSLITLDINRYSGFSPTVVRHSTLPVSVHPNGSDPISMSPPNGPASPPNGLGAGLGSPSTASRRLSALDASRNPLPNQTVNFDPRTLNLHLALRVSEVLACAEPMWDWVVDFQECEVRPGKHTQQIRDASVSSRGLRRRHPMQAELMALTRMEFDALLTRFDLDMKTQMHLGAALEDRLGWPLYPISSHSSEDRDTYEAMCAVWDAYQ